MVSFSVVVKVHLRPLSEWRFFVDADWGGRIEDSRSTTGWMLRLQGIPVFTASKVQKRPALSSGEAEWNGVETVCREIEWFKGFLDEVGVNMILPLPIWEDNSTAISQRSRSILLEQSTTGSLNTMFVGVSTVG